MSKRQTRIMILLPDDMLAAVEDYRFAWRLDSRTEAIRALIRNSLEAPASQRRRPPLAGAAGKVEAS